MLSRIIEKPNERKFCLCSCDEKALASAFPVSPLRYYRLSAASFIPLYHVAIAIVAGGDSAAATAAVTPRWGLTSILDVKGKQSFFSNRNCINKRRQRASSSLVSGPGCVMYS